MAKPMVKIHNSETDEIIDREMTDAEYAQWQQDIADEEAKKAALAEKETARTALLNRLGITEDEAKLLLGGN